MLKYLILPALGICLFVLDACKCEEEQCSGFQTEHWSWLRYKTGDTVIYTNTVGREHRFVFGKTEQTAPYVAVGERSPQQLSCNSPICSPAKGHITATHITDSTDSPIILWYSLRQFYSNSDKRLAVLEYQIGDLSSDVVIEPIRVDGSHPSVDFEYDMYSDIIAIGGKVYTQVAIQQHTQESKHLYAIHRVYITKGYGVVAFEDSTGLYYIK